MNIDSFFRCYDERRIILASSSIVIAKNKFATNIQNANQHFAWNLHQSWQTKSPYLNEYDIHMFRMKARINMFTVDLILSGRQKDSFDLFGKPSTRFSHPQEVSEKRVTCSFSLHFRGKFSFDGEFSVMRPQPTSLFAFTASDKDESLRHGCGNTRRKIKGRWMQDRGLMWTKIHRSICRRIGLENFSKVVHSEM